MPEHKACSMIIPHGYKTKFQIRVLRKVLHKISYHYYGSIPGKKKLKTEIAGMSWEITKKPLEE